MGWPTSNDRDTFLIASIENYICLKSLWSINLARVLFDVCVVSKNDDGDDRVDDDGDEDRDTLLIATMETF